jgi:hypothetical protein
MKNSNHIVHASRNESGCYSIIPSACIYRISDAAGKITDGEFLRGWGKYSEALKIDGKGWFFCTPTAAKKLWAHHQKTA